MKTSEPSRQLYVDETIVTASGTASKLLGPNDRRYAIVISSHPTNRLTVSFKGTPVIDAGINIPAGVAPWTLLYDHFGQAIREQINVVASAGATTIAVLDVFEVDCPCDDKYASPVVRPTPIE